jgi:HPt (histidine-containing phosphotransfer) domain-containing protein
MSQSKSTDRDYETMMQELREEYLISISEKCTELQRNFRNRELTEVRESFHKMKGSGATYGVPEVSKLASILEYLCDSREQELNWAVPQAIEWLQKIKEHRMNDSVFELELEPKFILLSNLVGRRID